MTYLIDGYNLLFFFFESKQAFASQRQTLISSLQKTLSSLHLSGMLIFDGAHRRDEESGVSYKSPLEIVYTPKGQNADSFIVEVLSLSKNPKQITVVTNDKGLTRHARSMHAPVQTNQEFIQFLQKKNNQPKKEKIITETSQNLERLEKIFEKRLIELDALQGRYL